jgi:hypothetical protein
MSFYITSYISGTVCPIDTIPTINHTMLMLIYHRVILDLSQSSNLLQKSKMADKMEVILHEKNLCNIPKCS